MNKELFLLSLLEIGITIVIAIGILYGVLQFINRRWKVKYEVQEDNLAFTIFSGSLLFSVGYLLTGSIQPIINSLRTISQQYKGGLLVLQSSKYVFLFIAIGVIIAALVNMISIFLFNLITPNVDELDSIRKGNIHTAIYLGIILILISLFVQEGYVLLLQSLMPIAGGTFD